MKKIIISGLMLLMALCCFNSYAGIRMVTNANDTGDGSLRNETIAMQPNDTLMFAESLRNDTIWIGSTITHTFSSSSGNRGAALTFIGNGVVIATKGTSSISFKINYSANAFKNMHFYNCQLDMSNSYTAGKLINCSFQKISTRGMSLFKISKPYGVTASASFYAEGCYFYGGHTTLGAGNISILDFDSAEFVSCTIENDIPKSFMEISCPSTFTNCIVFHQKEYHSSYPLFYDYTKTRGIYTFKGHNVIKGTFSNPDNVTFTETDTINAAMQRNPLALHDGFWKPVISGAAHQRLPAGAVIEGVTFPEYDILGNAIDYAQANHSGAIQEAVPYTYLDDIRFTEEALTLYTGGDMLDLNTLLAFDPTDADNRNVSWTLVSEMPYEGVITLGEDGTVTPLKEGIATVKVTSEEHSLEAEILITVLVPTPVEGIAFGNVGASHVLYVGDEFQLEVVFTPEDAYNKNVAWTSTDPTKVSVDDNGLVKAEAYGTATVRATSEDGSYRASVAITVLRDIRVNNVSLNIHALALDKNGETEQLTATVKPDNARYRDVVWTSSNEEVATVSATGLVTSLAVGEATIRVTSVDEKAPLYDECVVTVSEPSYTNGVYFLNEDWFGHRWSSINFLTNEGRWRYEVYQKNNPESRLGVTAQYGAIYGGRMYIDAKQDGGAGENVSGGRFFIADAENLIEQKKFARIGVNGSGGDGRAFVGVDEHKGYVGTSNGIHVIDLETQEFTGHVSGADGATQGGDDNPLDPGLYTGQVGTMVRAGNYVFAIHQSQGLLVINPETDRIDSILTNYHYATLTLARDGYLYSGVTEQQGSGGLNDPALNILVKLNPHTLETTEIALPEGYTAPQASWGAWQADAAFASKQENKFYWKGGSGGSWSGKQVLVYDIDNDAFDVALDLAGYDDGSWGIYGGGVGIHPETDEIYAALLIALGENTYSTIKFNPHTGDIATYPMKNQYWFPAMPIFPDNYPPEPAELPVQKFSETYESLVIPFDSLVGDRDNLTAGIVTKINGVSNTELLEAAIVGYNLVVTPKRWRKGTGTVSLRFNSNGKTAIADVTFAAPDETGIKPVSSTVKVYPNPFADYIIVNTEAAGTAVIYDVSGKAVISESVQIGSNRISTSTLSKGVYILESGLNAVKIVK